MRMFLLYIKSSGRDWITATEESVNTTWVLENALKADVPLDLLNRGRS